MAWRKILHLQKRKLPRRLVQKVLFLMKILKNFGLFLLFYGEHGEVSFLTSRIDYVTCLSLIRSTKISISAIRDPCYPFRRDPCLKSSGTILSKNNRLRPLHVFSFLKCRCWTNQAPDLPLWRKKILISTRIFLPLKSFSCTLFDGLTFNTRGYFASWGRERPAIKKIYTYFIC